jgi:hypothetical protein
MTSNALLFRLTGRCTFRRTLVVQDLSSGASTEPVDDTNPYGSDADPDTETVAQAFADLDRLTLQAERATAARKRAEDELTRAKQIEDKLLTREIPELLFRMRLEKCTTASGIDVSVKRDIKASLPGLDRVDARLGAFRWLTDNGHAGVIKNTVRIDLDRGEDARADELVASLRLQGFEPQANKDVHAATLGALVRELMGDGKIVPKEFFNLFDQMIVKLVRK